MVTYVEGFDEPVSAAKLSEISVGDGTSWMFGRLGFENLARDDVLLEPLEGARESTTVSKECWNVARAMADTLQQAMLPASETDTTGRIVLFVDETGETTGIPSVETCANALGLKPTAEGRDLRAESTVFATDWSKPPCVTFCYDEIYVEDLDELGDDHRNILAVTNIMLSELTDHFEFNMSDEVVCAPVLYGGRKGNAIIAVLSMRVWT
eukprot:jgi/Psemu1/302051/fgenesh1_kg.56_\